MRKVLIVDLTRFGDLLQTSPTILGLREGDPDTRVTVLVERNFAEVCRGLPAVDEVCEIDLDGLSRELLAETADGFRGAYRIIEDLIGRLRAERFDLALNYSSSRMSAVLLRLIGVPDTRGWTMSADGHRLIAHRWSRLFSASCLVRRQAPFNLVDYYKRVAGVTAGPRRVVFQVPEPVRARGLEVLTRSGVTAETPLIAFQLGASRDARRWPVSSYVALGRELATRLGARILLCGGGGERTVAEEVGAALGPAAIDVCGRTTIAELGALLERADLLVTPDTGPMHMAVAVGTPVVALFFGPAMPFDTAPYAEDQVCLHAEVACAPCDHNVTCRDPFCRDTLVPAAVAEAVVARRAGDWAALAAASRCWPGLGWYRTTFDAEGLADLVRLGDRPAPRGEALRRAYRQLWKRVLDGTPPPTAERIACPREAAVVRALVAMAEGAAEQAAEVEAVARGGEGVDLTQLETLAYGLEEADTRLFRYGAMHEPATLLLQAFRFEKENLDAGDVVGLAAATRVLHEELAARARLLVTLLEGEERDHAHSA